MMMFCRYWAFVGDHGVARFEPHISLRAIQGCAQADEATARKKTRSAQSWTTAGSSGFVGVPKVIREVFGSAAEQNSIQRVLSPIFLPLEEPVEHALSGGTEWLLIAVSVVAAVTGLLLGWNWYAKQRGRIPARIAAAFPALYELVEDKFDVDEAYDFLFVRPFHWLARMLWKVVDVLIIDGVLNAGAFLVELTGDLLRFLQTGNVRNYALTFFLGVVGLLLLVIGVSF